jgi:hypothetical protein
VNPYACGSGEAQVSNDVNEAVHIEAVKKAQDVEENDSGTTAGADGAFHLMYDVKVQWP